MRAFTKMTSFPVLTCAAAMAAALAAAGCAEPDAEPDVEGLDPEPVAEAETRLGDPRHFTLGLVQLFDDDGTLMGYGYSNNVGGGKVFQRWMLFKNDEGNNFQIRRYNHSWDPALIEDEVAASPLGWAQLVQTLWPEASLGTEKRYARCVSSLYEHGGTYDSGVWTSLPASAPTPAYPAWNAASQSWQAVVPDMSLPLQSSPLVWPPTAQWVQNNVRMYRQGDPGDGYVYQDYTIHPSIIVGRFLVDRSVNDTYNTEHFFMKSSYATAGVVNKRTRLADGASSAWPTFTSFWQYLPSVWAAGTGIAMTGCINHGALPSVL